MSRNSDNTQKSKDIKVSFIIFGLILLIIAGCYHYFKSIMPESMFDQGKKYYEIGEYGKALDIFNRVVTAKPFDVEPVYYQALALSKLPPTYENQKLLQEISQLEDYDKASEIAENILDEMRKQLLSQVGSNYIDNVMYKEKLVRWNNSEPITYAIFSDYNVPVENVVAVKRAIQNWQTATNGQVRFQEQPQNRNANICIRFVDDVSLSQEYVENMVGKTIPSIEETHLNQMDVYIRKFDSRGRLYTKEEILSVVQHEIGHALGIGGHSSNFEDVMYHSGDFIDETTITSKPISRRDVNTIGLLYKMYPDVIDIPVEGEDRKDFIYHDIFTTQPGVNYEYEITRLMSELKNDRKNIINWVDLATNYSYKKQYARSNHILTNALSLTDTDIQNQHVILYNLAVNWYKMKNYEKAREYLVLSKQFGDDFETQFLETLIDAKTGRTAMAMDKLNILSKNYPQSIDVAVKLAELYYKQKNMSAVKKVIEDVIKYNPKAETDKRVMKYRKKKN